MVEFVRYPRKFVLGEVLQREIEARTEIRRCTNDARRLQRVEQLATSGKPEFAEIVAAGQNWTHFRGSANGVTAHVFVPYGAHELTSMLRVKPSFVSAGPYGPCAVGVELVDAEGNCHAQQWEVR